MSCIFLPYPHGVYLGLPSELYRQQKDLEKAIQDMRRAHSLDRSNFENKQRLAAFYSESADNHLSQGEYAFASTEYTNAIELDDTCISAFWGRAKAWMSLQVTCVLYGQTLVYLSDVPIYRILKEQGKISTEF